MTQIKTREEILAYLEYFYIEEDGEAVYSEYLLNCLEKQCLIIYADSKTLIEDEIKKKLEG